LIKEHPSPVKKFYNYVANSIKETKSFAPFWNVLTILWNAEMNYNDGNDDDHNDDDDEDPLC
jgi:hypothetical protein